MKFLITPYIFKNNYKKICFSINKEWYDLFKTFKSNLNMVTYDENILINKKLLSGYNGVIFSGGGEIYSNRKNKLNLLRDRFEKKLLDVAIKNHIPILAVCRGYQLVGNKFRFVQKKVKFHKNNNHNIFSEDKKKVINVNSYHSYGIIKLNHDFKSLFKHNDKTIEACISKSKKILCLMFHPERYSKDQIYINNLIKENFKIK